MGHNNAFLSFFSDIYYAALNLVTYIMSNTDMHNSFDLI